MDAYQAAVIANIQLHQGLHLDFSTCQLSSHVVLIRAILSKTFPVMTTQNEEQPASQPGNATVESKIRTDENLPDKSTSETKKEEKAAPVSNYWRILSFGTRVNHCVLLIALASAVASGTTLPLMNIFFGKDGEGSVGHNMTKFVAWLTWPALILLLDC
jgi:hypothetical protein